MGRVPEKNSIVTIMIQALLLSYIITGAMLLLLTMLLYKLQLSEPIVAIGIVAIYIICSFLGGFFSGKKIKDRKFIWGLLLGALYFLILTVISLIVNRSLQESVSNFFTTLLICIGSGMLGGMLS